MRPAFRLAGFNGGGQCVLIHRTSPPVLQGIGYNPLRLLRWAVRVLPIPALDGGQSCACIFEMVTKKKIPAKVYQTVTTIFFVALLALMAVITVKDIIGLF